MSDPAQTLYLASLCYGGSAHARHLRALLALEAACAARALPLRLDLSGGDALVGRGRAGVLARFLQAGASHLLFVDPEVGFTPEAVFRLLAAGKDVVGAAPTRTPGDSAASQAEAVEADFLLVSRAAGRRMVEGYPGLRARLGDVHAAGVAEAAMVFDSLIDPATGRYLSDAESFCRRWRDLGGEVWRLEEPGLARPS